MVMVGVAQKLTVCFPLYSAHIWACLIALPSPCQRLCMQLKLFTGKVGGTALIRERVS